MECAGDSFSAKVIKVTAGGGTRHESEWHGIQTLASEIESGEVRLVLVHYGARPLVTPGEIQRVIDAARESGAAVVGIPVPPSSGLMVISGGYNKDLPPDLWAVQTPQGFDAQLVLQCHYLAMADGFQGVDTAAVVNRTGHQVRVVEGHCRNFKITPREDLITAELVLREMPPWDGFLQL